jgi:nucleoside-diphosphate-sugar epimerase
MARYFVTGATGFVGSHLVQALSEQGHTVWCLARTAPALKNSGDSVHWISGNLSQRAQYQRVLEQVEYVIHLAGTVVARRKEIFHSANVESTESLLTACREAGNSIKRFVHISSIAAMGPNLHGEPLRGSDACAPISEYGRSKLAGERLVLQAAEWFPVTVLRPSFIYGRGDLRGAKYFQSFLSGNVSAWAGSIRSVSLCHVADVVRCCIEAVTAERAAGQVLLISDPHPYTWEEIVDTIHDVLCERHPLLRGLLEGRLHAFRDRLQTFARDSGGIRGPHSWACDTSKTEELLGGMHFSLREGAGEAIGWYVDHLRLGALHAARPSEYSQEIHP